MDWQDKYGLSRMFVCRSIDGLNQRFSVCDRKIWESAVDLIVRTKFNYRTEGKNLKDISKKNT